MGWPTHPITTHAPPPAANTRARGRSMWQQRPVTADLVTCAAADVAYLIPLAGAAGA